MSTLEEEVAAFTRSRMLSIMYSYETKSKNLPNGPDTVHRIYLNSFTHLSVVLAAMIFGSRAGSADKKLPKSVS